MNAPQAIARPTVTPLPASFGATITDIDLTALSDADWALVEDAFNTYALLIFPGQHLSKEAQEAFGERFGPIEMLRPGHKTAPISNRRKDGRLLADDEHAMQIMLGNEGWHTDSSYMHVSAKASILSAQVLPRTGGETEWADMRAAWDALPPDAQGRLEGLSAYHSIRYSQAKIGHTDLSQGGYGLSEETPPLRPLVKVHPATGRKSLYIGRHAYGVPGMDEGESERLLAELVTFACQPPRVWRHSWTPGDVAVWDNRCLLHRARPYDHREQRTMRHVRISGDPVTERSMNAP
jgi:alpha-ketoglutarate-dependent taurine dioxygenase